MSLTSVQMRALQDALGDLEAKARHVATPEGARHFDKPIGAVIGGEDVTELLKGASENLRRAYKELSNPKKYAAYIDKNDQGGGCDDIAAAIERDYGLRQVHGYYTTRSGKQEFHSWNYDAYAMGNPRIFDASQYVFGSDGDGEDGPHIYKEDDTRFSEGSKRRERPLPPKRARPSTAPRMPEGRIGTTTRTVSGEKLVRYEHRMAGKGWITQDGYIIIGGVPMRDGTTSYEIYRALRPSDPEGTLIYDRSVGSGGGLEEAMHVVQSARRSLKSLIEELEEKVRHVATPAGERVFGKPIGSVIGGVANVPVVKMDYDSIIDSTPVVMIDGKLMFQPRISILDSNNPDYVAPEPKPVEWIYRAVSEAEWNGIIENGYMQTDGRMNLADWEGTVATTRDPSFYLPPRLGERGRVVKMKYDPSDGWWVDTDGYVKTPNKIPAERVNAVSDWYITGNPAKAYTHDQLLQDAIREAGNLITRLPDDYRGPNADLRDAYYRIQDTVTAKRYDDIETFTRHVYTDDELKTFLDQLDTLAAITESHEGSRLLADLVERAHATLGLMKASA